MLKKILLSLLTTATVSQAQAASGGSSTFPKPAQTMTRDRLMPHVGVSLGLNDPEASFSSSLEYGLDVGLQPWTPFGMGLEISGVSSERTMGNRPQDLDRTNFLLRGTYHLGGSRDLVRYSYLGFGAGAVVDNKAFKGTHSGIGPVAGFDIPINQDHFGESMSLGLATKYVFVSGPSPDSFSINGVAKYWF